MTTSRDTVLVAVLGGIDPTGGSGIGRDAAALASVGVTPIAIATALTVQDARGVQRIDPVDPSLIAAQLAAAIEAGASAVKTGMLHRAEVARAVRDGLRAHRIPLVVDPVLVASSGGTLADADLLPALRELAELATIVTPNLAEARALLDRSDVDAATAADALVAAGWNAALVTGGPEAANATGRNLASVPGGVGDAIDHLAWRSERIMLRAPRSMNEPRGTGCTFASLIAAGLARHLDLETACRVAKGRISRAIRNADGALLSLRDDPAWAHAGHPFE